MGVYLGSRAGMGPPSQPTLATGRTGMDPPSEYYGSNLIPGEVEPMTAMDIPEEQATTKNAKNLKDRIQNNTKDMRTDILK